MAERTAPPTEALASETERAERSLFEFSKQAWNLARPGDPYVNGWVFGCLCEHAQALAEGQIKKLAVACPPRHGKSVVFDVLMPAWRWVLHARTRFIFVTYSDLFAKRDSISCREIINSHWYQTRWGHRFTFKEDQNTQTLFSNDRGGHRLATTPGGAATSEGAEVVVADDITSVKQSFSKAALEEAWRFWTQTISSRFHNPNEFNLGVIMQRTGKNDLIGRLIAESFGYEVLTLPFEAEPHRIYSFPTKKSEPDTSAGDGGKPAPEPPPMPKHPIIPTSLQRRKPELMDRRKPGEVLWPERFTNPDTIRDLRKSVQAGAAGQLQQRPEGDAGTVFKSSKFKRFFTTWTEAGLAFILGADKDSPTVLARDCFWYQTIDTALKDGQENDYCAFATVAKTPRGQLLVFNVSRWRLLVPEQWPMVKQMREGLPVWDENDRTFKVPGVLRPWPGKPKFQAVEDKNSGTGLLQTARAEHRPLKPLEADSNKVMRAATIAGLYESGDVYHNAEGEWLADFEDELTSFPTGEHDDMVDAIAYAGILYIHDELLAAYTGDVVYNERVHAELDARKKLAEESGWIPPHLRPPEAAPAESLDDILRAITGEQKPRPPLTDDGGKIDPRYFHHDD